MTMISTSRRDLLGAIALVPALALPAMPAMAANGGWAAALAAWKRAVTASETYRDEVFQPARAAWQAQIDAIPHVGSEFTDVAGFKYPLSTRDEWAVRMARKELARKKEWHADDLDYRDYCQTIVDGADWREAEKERITATSGFISVWDRMAELEEAMSNALEAAFCTPATSMHELLEKMEMIDARGGFDVEEWTQAIMVDIRRLAAGGQ